MALFERNLPNWERAVRGLAGIALIAFTLMAGWNGWWLAAGVTGGIVMLWMAGYGFCPACALAGRRLPWGG
jgi:hypothetical protein